MDSWLFWMIMEVQFLLIGELEVEPSLRLVRARG